MKKTINLSLCFFVLTACMMLSTGCAPRIARPDQLTAPTPIYGNTGEYMCPYTQDGVMAEWTDKAINATIGASIGKHAGAFAGQKALEQVPFVGGWLGSMAGEAIGRKVAIEASGGWDYIKETSDLSFNSVDDMAIYLYVKCSSHEHYNAALKATMEIYPEMKKKYHKALVNASKQVQM